MSTERVLAPKTGLHPRRQMDESSTHQSGPLPTPERLAGPLTPDTVFQLHQTIGNAAVQRVLAQRSGVGPTELDDETTSAINRHLGHGASLDAGMSQKAGAALGTNFDDVTVHHDAAADQLSRQLGARAFTVGSDIFFRDGEYSPASHDGQHLLAHELTHVVQQGGGPANVQGKMSVNDPNDEYEAEADRMAAHVMDQPMGSTSPAQLQEDEEQLQLQEEEEELVQMQEMEEEEELVQP
ncbi:MAG: DUF4157 domain-containing protein [Anaerolineales bacterium]|nr:DUF4157 domain-containing protein [Anaerolineales bacterium]MCB8951956.1 DUF4157 domain-containing protein [Ardenticatenales bacterium]